MFCIIETSLYEFINGRAGTIDVDLDNGLLEVLVDGARYVVAKDEVRTLDIAANELPY